MNQSVVGSCEHVCELLGLKQNWEFDYIIGDCYFIGNVVPLEGNFNNNNNNNNNNS
jgi:hypothetical protein